MSGSSIDAIRDSVAELENILKTKFDIRGHGLGEYIREVQNLLSPELYRKLDYIRHERNKVMHESGYQLNDPDAFLKICAEAKQELNNIQPQGAYHNTHNYDSYSDPDLDIRIPIIDWVVANWIGAFLAIMIIGLVGNIPSIKGCLATEFALIAIVGVVFGTIGLCQTTVLPRYSNTSSFFWSIATAAGAIPFYLFVKLCEYFGQSYQFKSMPTVIPTLIIGAVLYLSMSLFQSLIIKLRGGKSSIWLMANILQGILFPLIIHFLLLVLGKSWQWVIILISIFLLPALCSFVTGAILGKNLLRLQQP